MNRRPNHRRLSVLVAAAISVPVLATAGCAHSAGSAAAGGSAPPTSSPSSSSPDRLKQMQQKVDSAQSAADAADRDAQSN